MKWRHKALYMRLMAFIRSETAYRIMQKGFGRLEADPMARIPTQIRMARWLTDNGHPPAGKTIFEVGTGNLPIVPIGFYLSGAATIITVDLNPRLDLGLSCRILDWIHQNPQEIHRLYGDLVSAELLDKRLAVISSTRHDIRAFFEAADIRNLAPFDSAETDLEDDSIDIHYSVKTLEHVPAPDIARILAEARRLIRPDGVACHLIDLSDHFSHQDPTIPAINFLRFSEEEWLKIAGNKYGYTNRLRFSEYRSMFETLRFEAHFEAKVDERSLGELDKGFPLDDAYNGWDPEDICTTFLDVLLRKPVE